jgi:hypothetical protein
MNEKTIELNGKEWIWEDAGTDGTALGKMLSRGCSIDGIPRIMFCCILRETKEIEFSKLANQMLDDGEKRVLETILRAENAGLLKG